LKNVDKDGKVIDDKKPYKHQADDLDAFVNMVLVDAKKNDGEMRDFLYRDRTHLSVYALAMYGMSLHKQGEKEKLEMVMKNISQFVVQDDENQTAYLNLPAGFWWYWYGSEYEAHAYYLKLLALTDPKSETASRLVKYLLNNRKHATYWNSTRDTALVVEAMADYLKASGENKPDMTVEVWLDGEKKQEVKITAADLFTFDNKFVLTGDEVTTGIHKLELKKQGTGPLYWNGYLTTFTLEEMIPKAGLEIKVQRKVYKLNKVDKKIKVAGSRGQAVDQKVEKYEREELDNMALLTSGDLVEVELEIDSKNDYEYILFEDMKAAGFEAVEVRSGYNGNDLNAYVEFRDNRVAFFARTLARGKHSVSYRLRAEIPGKFSALPARAAAMYAPELKGNSDEIKLRIQDEKK
jgi:alpha-2-macroglobulin